MPTRLSSTGTQFERWVRGSLKRIGFRDIDGGPTFNMGQFQVDAVGGWDDVLLVVEATQTSRTNASIRDRIVELRGKAGDLRRAFRDSDAYSGYRRFAFALVTKGYDYSDSDRDLANSEQTVHLIDSQVLKYYQQLAGTIGKQGALFNLLGELRVEPRDLSVHRTLAFRADMRNNHVGYLFFCEPQKLLEIAYVARRETGREHYYQRMLNASRLKQIRGFINEGGIFPNNIILAFDTRPQFRRHQMPDADIPSWLEWGELTFPKSYRAAWIIDGQHRLYAFGGDQSASRLQKMPVFAFERMTESKQAQFFIEINQEQRPVSRDLIWDLEADLSPTSPRGRIALTAKRLNEVGPLTGRVYLPLSGDTSRRKLKISSICNDLDDTKLLDERTKNMTERQRNRLIGTVSPERRFIRVADGIADFLRAILDVEDSETYRDTVILRPGGITLVLNVYEQVLISLDVRPSPEQLSDYGVAFVLALGDVVGGRAEAVSFVKNRLSSYAQRREVIHQVINGMRDVLEDQNFGQGIKIDRPLERRVAAVERKLAKMVADMLGLHTMNDLKQKAPEGVWRGVGRRVRAKADDALHTLLSLGEIKQIIGRQDNRSAVIDELTTTSSVFRSGDEVFVALEGLIEMRNPLQHGRSGGNYQLGQAYLSAFERVFESM